MNSNALRQPALNDDARAAFIEQATNANLDDREVFADVVARGLELSGITVREAGALLMTAPGTVSRWANGHSAPAKLMRKRVMQIFVRRVRKIAQQG